MRQSATPEEIRGVVAAIEARGFKAHPIPGVQRTAIGITGNRGAVDRPVFESLPGVLEVIPVTHGYKLVSREVKPEDTVVSVGGVPVEIESSDARATREAVRLLQAGHVLMIFPEGERSPNGEIGRFKPGAFRLAASLGVPVLPVTINGLGTSQVAFVWFFGRAAVPEARA